MTWQRLEEDYGSPEAIEQALFAKLENFPKVTMNLQMLHDLGDLLTELEATKLDGYLPGLAYLDTSKGVSPIVEKLPHSIQEKWMSFGSKYKQVAFPRFSVFANFICTEAKMQTDPSFNIFSQATPERRNWRGEGRHRFMSTKPKSARLRNVNQDTSSGQ